MIVLKDKKDIKFAPTSFLKDYEWESHGQYDSLDFVNPDVKVLSVQFTKVGEKTYKAFPNLEWIIVRQHGFDNVNIAECEKRGIGIATTKPFAQSTADWINSFIKETDNVALIGYGSIGSKVKANNIYSFLRKSDYSNVSNFDTLVVTVPPRGNDKLIGEKILSNFKGKLISVSRSNVIDNISLYKYIDNITHAYVDTLDDHLRQYLIDTGKVTYTKHTAFEYGFSYENNTKYFDDLNSIIVDCLNNNVDKPILSRSERVTF
jgi:lactate dehydrogenase-like 2-hydroxyacid dehydrogenase